MHVAAACARGFVAVLVLLALTFSARGDALDDSLNEAIDQTELTEFSEIYESVAGEDLRGELLARAKGERAFDADEILKSLLDAFLSALKAGAGRLPALLAPPILFSLAARFAPRGEGAARFACALALSAVMGGDLLSFIRAAEESVGAMADAMLALFPPMLALLSAVGGSASAALIQPAIAAAGGGMTAAIRSVTLSLLSVSAALTLVSSLSQPSRVDGLAKLLKTAAAWSLGVCFTVYISVCALRGFGAAAADGVSLRTAKYAVDHFVPVIGGMVADTLDTLAGCSLMIKNALGVTGLTVLSLTAFGPLTRTLAGAALYRLAGALLEPLQNERASKTLSAFGDILTLLFITQLAVGAMFFLLIGQVVMMGNMTVMIR